MNEGPIVVRRVGTVEEADLIVAWLDINGVEAVVLDRDNPGTLAFGVTDVEGAAICVKDPATAQQAKGLLEQHDRERAEKHARPETKGEVTVTCEECGHANAFPVDSQGTVQACAECSAHVDVPAKRARP